MNISPAVVGVGAGIATGIGATVAGIKVTDGIAERNPTGSSSDGQSTLVSLGMGALGIGSIVGGVFASSRGNAMLGAGLIGAGAGSVVGAIGTAIGFNARHGVGVDTMVSNTMSAYNRDFDDQLDLNPRWRTPEDVRMQRTRHEHSDGSVSYTTTFHTIGRLAAAANTNGDGVVTRPELRAAIAKFDQDGDGRLKGSEKRDFDRQLGEQSFYGGTDWHWNPGPGYPNPGPGGPTGPGDEDGGYYPGPGGGGTAPGDES